MPLPLPRLDDEDEEHNALLRRALPLVVVVPPNATSDISVVAQCVFLWRVSLSLSYPLFFFFSIFPRKNNVFFFEIEKKKISRERIEKYSCFYCHY
jgi:hypothetical protein